MASIIKVGAKWRALIRRKGFPSYCKTFRTQAQAEVWARGIEAEMDRGNAPQAAAVVGRRLLLGDVLDTYSKLREQSRPILDTSSEHYMLKRIKLGLGRLDATSMTPQDLQAYCAERAEEGAGPYTVNMEMSKLGTAMRYAAISLKLQLPDVVKDARPLLMHLGLIGGGGKRERRVTDDELYLLLQHLTSMRGQVYADVVQFAILSTMRRSEITRITWSGLDAEKRLVLVKDRKDPRKKMGNDQWVPLLNGAWELVQAQPRHDGEDRIFPIHPQTLSKYFTEACKALSIPDLHLHDMRHEGTSALFEQGYQVQQVALVTGHKSWTHLKRYTQLKPEDLHKGPSSPPPSPSPDTPH